MKHLFILLSVLLMGTGTALARQTDSLSAQKTGRKAFRRFEVGVRGGVNFTDYAFESVRIGNTRFASGPGRVGYETGFIVRLNLSRHLHVQSEIDYALVNYDVRSSGAFSRTVSLRTERLEIPVQIGFQFGVIRLFGGVQFRMAQTQRSNIPQLLRIGFNDDAIGVMGGAGLRIRKFFLEFRVTGYPRSRVWHEFRSDGLSKRVEAHRDLLYGGSLGFYF